MQGSFLKGVAMVVSLFVTGMIVFQTGCSKSNIPARSYDEHVNQASALFKEKRFDEALAEAQEAIKQDASRYQAHAVKAIILCDMGKYSEAKAAVNDALQVAPENKLAEAQNIVKYIAGAQGKGKVAEPPTGQQKDTVARHTGKPGTASQGYDDHVKQARALFKEQKWEEALAEAREAIKMDAERYQAYAIEALILSDAGKFADAGVSVDKALKLAPEEKRAEVQAVAEHIAGAQEVVATEPASSPQQLTGAAQRRYEALMLIIEDADHAKLAVERNELLGEFLQKSEPFIRENPDQLSVWMLRAVAAVELDQAKPGRKAGKELMRLGADDSEDAELRKVMAALERKGWLVELKETLTWPDGRKYEGECEDNIPNGRGIFTWPDSAKYDGEWKDGKKNGRGIMTLASGRKYEGEFKDDKSNGHGIMTWPDSAKYDGEWKDDKKNGRGIETLPNGTKQEGEWKDDVKQ